MSTNALNIVYKTAIVALEQATVTSDLAIAATAIPVHCKVMTQTPFIIDRRPYVLMSDAWEIGVNGLPNAERFTIQSISGETVTPLSDDIGYDYVATLNILAYDETAGWSGGLKNAYKQVDKTVVLIPGVEMAIQSDDFNARFKTLTDAPKIDFDDESSKFATGDEGKDLSIAGARSSEINFTEKLAWAGDADSIPVWDKLLKSMGHLRKAHEKGFAIIPSNFASLNSLISGSALSSGDTFYTEDGSDTADAALAGLKTHPLVAGDSFLVGAYGTTYVASEISGLEYLPIPYANELTATIWVITPENGMSPSSTVYRYIGAHGGNGSSISVGKVGDPYMLTGKYMAAYIGTMEISQAHNRVLTSSPTQVPEVMLSNLVTVPAYNQAGSKTVEISQFNLDMGGVVNPFIDQSTGTGYAFYVTSDRDPKLTMNPYHVRKNLDDIDYIVTNMTTGPVIIQSAISNPHITIEIFRGQLLQPALGSREGYMSTDRTYRALRNNLGNGASEQYAPDITMYGILIGSRS
jgi:hypothetical protein